MRRDLRRTLALGAIVPLAFAACGGDDDGGDGGPPPGPLPEGTVHVVAEDSLHFDADSYAATAGTVDFLYENGGAIAHTLVIEDVSEDDFKLEVSGSGDTDEGSAELEAGDYVLYCDIPGHRSGGMEADLAVS